MKSLGYLPYLLLTVVVGVYLFSFIGFDGIFGDLGDARLNNYFLEHGYQFIAGNHASFWSPAFFYPSEYVMAYSDNHMGTLPFYAFFRLLGFSIESSFQFWIFVIFLLNALVCYGVLRFFGFNVAGSIAGALLFALAAPVMLKTNHIQLMPRFMVPVVFYVGVRFVESLDAKYFYIFCAALVYQFYIGIYIGFFILMGLVLLAPFVIAYIFKNHNLSAFFAPKCLAKLFFTCSVSLGLLFALFYPYVLQSVSSGGRPWAEIASMLPRIESWFYTSGSFFGVFNRLGTDLPMQHEHMMFLGLVPYALYAMGLVFYIKKPSLSCGSDISVFASLLLVPMFAIFTLSIYDWSLYGYTFYLIPGFDAIRAVSRVVVFLVFLFSVLVAYVFTQISQSNLNNYIKFGAISAIFMLGCFEQYRPYLSTYSKPQAQQRYHDIYNQIKSLDYDVLYLSSPVPNPAFYMTELDAMYVLLISTKPTINGYSGNKPPLYPLYETNDYMQWININKDAFDDKVLLVYDTTTSTHKLIPISSAKSKNTNP